MNLRFIIIDDQTESVTYLKKLLGTLDWTNVAVWPGDSVGQKTFNDWDKAFEKIARLKENPDWDPETNCCVLVLDVALGEKAVHILGGIDAINRRLSTPHFDSYVKVILTRYEPMVARNAVRDGIDAILEKEIIFSRIAGGAPVENLKLGIEEAIRNWSRRTGRDTPISPNDRHVKLLDSPPMRLMEAALGRTIVDGVVNHVARDWGEVSVDALSGGYSGAFLARITDASGNRQIVCKLSKNQQLIDEEFSKWNRLFAYPVYQGFVMPMAKPEFLSTFGQVHFLQQASLTGATLESTLLEEIARPSEAKLVSSLRAIKAIARLVEKACAIVERKTPNLLVMTAGDLNRFEGSIPLLANLRDRCVELNFLDDDAWHTKSAIAKFASETVKQWNTLTSRAAFGDLPTSPQHGDMNPRNVLLTEAKPALIDFARFGFWPIGYDLTRFELQLFLRLTGAVDRKDHFPNQLKVWLSLWGEVRDGQVNAKYKGEKDLQITRRVLAAIEPVTTKVGQMLEEHGADPRQVFALMRCFDAIKICSYQDASPFKRLLFLLIALDNARLACPAFGRKRRSN